MVLGIKDVMSPPPLFCNLLPPTPCPDGREKTRDDSNLRLGERTKSVFFEVKIKVNKIGTRQHFLCCLFG